MNIFSVLLTQILYRPIFNVLIIFLAIFGGNLGIAIILLTLLVRGIMFKSTAAGANMQQGMSDLQPKIEELQKKYENDPQKLSEETMKLFKSEGKAPLKGCLTMLIQIPIFICLYRVVRKFAGGEGIPPEWLYSFFYSFGNNYTDLMNIDTDFLGWNLLEKGNRVLTILVVLLNYGQMRLTSLAQPKQTAKLPGATMPDMSKMMGTMSIGMSLMMGALVYSLNSAIGLYLATTSVFSIVQYTWKYRALIKVKWNELFHKNRPVIINPK
ncbi:MAG: YidC/Oxa1 family membrane protein insertase [Candidatus Peribacteria bacterium]|jgi:YidC/Oxa1 family membrane protein insertase|nr:YidC/Oxa1 family membrane protein insertase [Candidatus Peribacteria bacterium]